MDDQRLDRRTTRQINEDLLAPLRTTHWTYFAFVAVLLAIVIAGALAWSYQIRTGIGQTNLRPSIFWGIYIASFVFWVGVSHAGTLISGALRLTHSDWRFPVTRIAELMTVISIIIAASFIFYHLGRVWRWFYLVPYPNQRELWPNFRSPLMWDATAIFTYAIASTIYLYLPIIPDFALMRDRISGWRRPLYRVLALGWQGTQREWRIHGMAVRIITPLIFMVAVSVHSIVGWDFGMALAPMWHTAIMAPYFVAGAVHSGLGMALVGMYFVRRAYRFETYLQPLHFDKVGKLLVVTTLVWGYLYWSERLTVWYGMEPAEMAVLMSQTTGPYAMPQWVMVACNFLIPIMTVTIPAFRHWPFGMMVLGIVINIGMYIERVLIIVPSLGYPRFPYEWEAYFPSAVEFTIVVAAIALAILLYVLAIKLIPVVSLWEEKEVKSRDPRL